MYFILDNQTGKAGKFVVGWKLTGDKEYSVGNPGQVRVEETSMMTPEYIFFVENGRQPGLGKYGPCPANGDDDKIEDGCSITFKKMGKYVVS